MVLINILNINNKIFKVSKTKCLSNLFKNHYFNINEAFSIISHEEKILFNHQYNNFEFEYLRIANFFKKDLENFRIASQDLLKSERKNTFIDEFLSLKNKNTPIIESLLTYKKNFQNVENFLKNMKIQELLLYLSLSNRIKIFSDDFITKIYDLLKKDEILSLEKNNFNKLLWCYSNYNMFHLNLQNSLNTRLHNETDNKTNTNNLFEADNLNRYIKSLALYFSLKFEETTCFHEILLNSLILHLEKFKFIDKKLLQSIWNFLITLSLRNNEFKNKIDNILAKLPFHKPFVNKSQLQLNFKTTLLEFCKDNILEFQEEKKILCYFVDFFIEPNIILEINGPSHYIDCNSFRKFGYDEVRIKNLLFLKNEVYEINYLKWKKMNDKYKLEYVKKLLFM